MVDHAEFFANLGPALAEVGLEGPRVVSGHVARGRAGSLSYGIGFKGDGKVRRRIYVEVSGQGDLDLLEGGFLRPEIAQRVDAVSAVQDAPNGPGLLKWGPFQAIDVERQPQNAAAWAASTCHQLVNVLQLVATRSADRAAEGDDEGRRRPRPENTGSRRAPVVIDEERLRRAAPAELPAMLVDIARASEVRRADLSVRSVVHVPGRAPSQTPLPSDVHPELAIALASYGISSLYAHQAAVWGLVQRGKDAVVVTPTASGKSLCFNLPVVDRCLKYPLAKALYFYPTKALANDQLTALRDLLSHVDPAPNVAVYHGDLSQEEREAIRTNPPNILLATPDILHHQQLPKHATWAGWWANLQFVVIDEAHAYRGVFGSQVGHVVRRIRRIAAHYGTDPIFIAASATIGNPQEHVSNLVGRSPAVVDSDGARQVARDLVIWEPLIIDSRGQAVAFGKSEAEAGRLFVGALRAGHSTIVFAKSRRSVERILRRSRRALINANEPALAGAIEAYRAGYSRERREAIERGLRHGHVKGVVATNALELGIDIGSLDVAILSTYPGSTMSFRQQAGRAGRQDRPALVLMIASQNPLDQYVASSPETLVAASPEHAVVDLANMRVASGQLGCSARERRLTSDDEPLFGAMLRRLVPSLVEDQILMPVPSGWSAGPNAARPRDISLRSIEGRPYALWAGSRRVGEIDARAVPREAHLGAVYLHDGDAYRVQSVDTAARSIQLAAVDDGVLTEPVADRFIDLLSLNDERPAFGGRARVSLGRMKVSTRVIGYREIDEETGRQRGGITSISPMRFDLSSVGIRIEPFAGVDPAGLHGVEHLLRGLAPLTILCDRSDLDGHTDAELAGGSAYVYDRHEGGVGLAERLYEALDPILEAMADRIANCLCVDGCPACVQSGSCLLENDFLDKAATAQLIGAAT
jgi:DEAD/DEAH box helicase domain-containing protein